MVVYVVFGDVWPDSYGMDMRCFGVFTTPEKAEELHQSLEKDETVFRSFVQEFIADEKVEESVAVYIE